MLQLVAWAAAARVEGGEAVLEVEGAVAALKSGAECERGVWWW